ncbi:MAG: calcium/sodium antiporter [Casimicrobiaceae bacterium]|nr:calcium/sodium antiporter [Casimicrobiaceae bacterium]MCX8098738.1 calcium/sodium antiporter [Casimicrobiaceae bacterium]
MNVLLFFAGLAALALGAEALVRGASRLALTLGLSPLVVGLTVVAFGTSAPEAAVTIGAAYTGEAAVAIGNVVGSNILNVLVILGVAALLSPLVVHIQLIRQEVPIMIAASVGVAIMAADARLSALEGALLTLALVTYTAFLVVKARRERAAEIEQYRAEIGPRSPEDRHDLLALPLVQVLLIGFGLAFLVLGARWLVTAAVALAQWFGVSDVVIGLTIVALGTSLPEIATSVLAVWKGERDLAAGNVVGSNIFNLLACLGLAALVAPEGLPVPQSVLRFDLWVMLAVAVACLPVFLSGQGIARWEGGLFLFYYAAYVSYQILAHEHHAAVQVFSTVMLAFVVPLTAVTLAVSVLPLRRARRQAADSRDPVR